jgi:hypothetical protein
MLCLVFSMWIYWYQGGYGWSAELGAFESKLETLLSIFLRK